MFENESAKVLFFFVNRQKTTGNRDWGKTILAAAWKLHFMILFGNDEMRGKPISTIYYRLTFGHLCRLYSSANVP